ncbi:MAG: peptidase S16 [Rhodospirillaceae bacterium]|jgi:uncharacterized protein|nr:peptidase S16 [Rhodospirillaceae bacterium]MBT5242951.1 peptidase S16 [Rhodospirillaceae bacterium]MBT5563175.1 peptidase S16 [Rhodospirillaceae bacterium]MBT6243490.1 peptidase S16 [Rhodospirillaceae bacterium]MBT7137539.1 peptidase S16 [Rhodospirillaceae bacterium]
MTGTYGDLGISVFPDVIALFPLSGALLLPHGHLPLNIFEPRYLSMVEDALGNGRVIGMVQPQGVCADPVPDNAPLYPIGCAGRVVSFEETETGHLFIALRGLCRFHIDSELALQQGYRRAQVDYSAFAADIREDEGTIPDRPRLIGAVRQFFELKDIEVDWQAIEEASDETLVTSLAMICPLASSEKQALLETPGLSERGELLSSLMEMALLEDSDQAGLFRH